MPTYEITLSNGSVYQVDGPDGATEQQLMGAVAGQMAPDDLSVARAKNDSFGAFLREQAKKPREGETEDQRNKRLYGSLPDRKPGTIENVARAALQGLTFGGGDEIVAAGAAGLDALTSDTSFSDAYNARVASERGNLDRFRDKNPVAAYGSEIAGAIPTAMMPLGALGRLAQSGSLAARIGAGAVIGAGQGGVYGFNTGDGMSDRLSGAATGGATGGIIGALAPAAGAAVGRAAKKLMTSKANAALTKSAPTAGQLKAAAGRAYDRAAASGVKLSPDSLKREVSALQSRLMQEGLDPTLHPKAAGIMNRLQDIAKSNGEIPDVTVLRRLASGVAGSNDASERRLGTMMVDAIDDYVARLGPNDVLSGNPAALADDLAQARTLYRRGKGSEMIDDVFTKADLQASGVENGLRIQFRQILNNPKLRRGLSAEEIDAMEKVVKGTPVSNVLRKLGRLGFGAGQQHNVLSGMLGSAGGAGVGSAVGGPVGAAVGGVALPALGYGAQRAAEGITARNARLAQALMASGGRGAPVYVSPQIQRMTEALLQRNVPVSAPMRDALMSGR